MTAIVETSPPAAGSWIETHEHLARVMAAGLRDFADMVADSPEVAPLLRVMLSNLMLPVSAAEDPTGAMTALVDAANSHHGAASQARYTGVNLDFGPAVRIWVMPQAPTEPVGFVVEAAPEPPVDEAELVADGPTLDVPADETLPDGPAVDAAAVSA